MQRTSLAPLLSATFSRDSVRIIMLSLYAILMLLRLFHDLDQTPALLPAHRPGFHDPDGVSNAGHVFFVMCHELRSTADEFPIDRMLYLAVYCNSDRLLHLVADDLADPFLSEISFLFHPITFVGIP